MKRNAQNRTGKDSMIGKEKRNSTSYPTSNRLFAWVLGLMLGLFALPAFGEHVHQLYYDNSNWTDTDLTSLTGGPSPAFVGMTAFNTTPNNDLHVFYISYSDSHVHELFYNGSSWVDADITSATGGVPAATSWFLVPISGFALGNAQYVYFCGNDDDVHEYSYGDGGNWNWVDQNLNALAVGGGAANCSTFSNGLVAYATPGNSQRHVFYQPSSGPNDIYHFVLKGSAWYVEDETLTTHGAKGDGTWMAGFAIGNAQYAYFEDAKGNIHEYSYGDGGNWNWVDKNLTKLTKGPKSALQLQTGVTSFVIPGTSRKEVYYAANPFFDLHQMTFKNKKWTDTDIGGPAPLSSSQMVAFATAPNDQFHLYEQVVAGGNGVDQLYYNGSWSSQQLVSVLTAGGGTTGFAIGNLQYVYYITFD
jgi:hypothetical protein